MTYAHGGNLQELARKSGRSLGSIRDFSANINPLGPPEWLRSTISRHVSDLQHYPDPDCLEMLAAAGERYAAQPGELLCGNGSTELLYQLVATCGKQQAYIPVPSYADYTRAARLARIPVTQIPLTPANGFSIEWKEMQTTMEPESLFIVGHPANPSGQTLEADALRELAYNRPDCLFLVDEAFGDFVEGFESLTQNRPANVAVLLSLTKLYAVPGLRLGCAIAAEGWCQSVREQQLPWSTNTLAQAVGAAALRDGDYAKRTRAFVARERVYLQQELATIAGLQVCPGKANFLLVRLVRSQPTARELAERLLREQGIAIRVCENFAGLDGAWFRIAVRTREENARLVVALQSVLAARAPIRAGACAKKPAIMFQGTSSNAGKSVLTAALCRILLQDGRRVAPFKAQNMSLNSFVTRDGCEMGRAQVVQAQACRLEPDVRMNPVLLKPNSDTGSQVIVNGHPVGNMRVNDYIRYKPTAFEAIQKAYDSLASDYDAIILEGAGSPGEVNLKAHDIVNMNMARYAQSPVLLVGDIDRGGVFASFIGTMEVLTEEERAMVAGFVVNRFRGQESLLQDAFDYTFRHTGRPVLGTVPYLHELNLPEEDSVSFKADQTAPGMITAGKVDVVVIDFPHISNFTDLDALRIEPDVNLRIIRSPEKLGRPDAVILPGSKNTLADLGWLRQTGLANAVVQLANNGRTEIIGICGGFQMLGKTISDLESIETHGQSSEGLGLLPLKTTMHPEKTLLRTSGVHRKSGHRVQGYEIHHGQTHAEGIEALITDSAGQAAGFSSLDERIWGTYLHGIFDADPFRRWFIDALRERKGLAPIGQIVAVYDIEAALDRLADVVRAKLDLPAIYQAMGLS